MQYDLFNISTILCIQLIINMVKHNPTIHIKLVSMNNVYFSMEEVHNDILLKWRCSKWNIHRKEHNDVILRKVHLTSYKYTNKIYTFIKWKLDRYGKAFGYSWPIPWPTSLDDMHTEVHTLCLDLGLASRVSIISSP